MRRPNHRPPSNIRVKNAIIEAIITDRRNTFVTITYREMEGPHRGSSQTVRLVVTPNTRIFNERGNSINVRGLEEGMFIDAIFSAAMTKSIPPQAEAYEIRVVRREPVRRVTEGRIGQVDVRNQFLLVFTSNAPSSAIRFNISPETVILDPLGRRVSLGNLFPGLRVQVEHAEFMTASIPPQTTAFVIRVVR